MCDKQTCLIIVVKEKAARRALFLAKLMSLQIAFRNIFDLYIKKAVPRLMQGNKSITISTAVVLFIMYLFKEKMMKPPKNLRHIPYIGYFSIFRTVITGESFWDRTYRVIVPFVDTLKTNGIYLVSQHKKRILLMDLISLSFKILLGIRKTWMGIICM